jgi:hypothetical protein
MARARSLTQFQEAFPGEAACAAFLFERQRLSVITTVTADKAKLATDARNLIHAGKVSRTGLTCTKATALMALAALEAVTEELP